MSDLGPYYKPMKQRRPTTQRCPGCRKELPLKTDKCPECGYMFGTARNWSRAFAGQVPGFYGNLGTIVFWVVAVIAVLYLLDAACQEFITPPTGPPPP